MIIDIKTKLNDLLKAYPFLLDFLASRWPRFGKLKNPILRRTIGKAATLGQAAEFGGLPAAELIAEVTAEIERRAGETVEAGEEEGGKAPLASRQERLELLKSIIRELHQGGDVALQKKRFAELIRDAAPAEIAEMEQSLIQEGMPEEEITRLCDIHVQVFKDALEQQALPAAAPGHPLRSLMAENRALEKVLAELKALVPAEGEPPVPASPADLGRQLLALAGKLAEADKHYLKKENQLFPLLESKGVSGPTRVMWTIHDDIRRDLKEFRRLLQAGETDAAFSLARLLITAMSDMIYKEEKILFPMSLETLEDADWARVKKGEEEIGYAWIEPGGEETSAVPKEGEKPAVPHVQQEAADQWSLSVGALTREQADLLLTHLPVDISFVDEEDTVVYYSATKDRIFTRTPAVIGRKVQNCHPSKSVQIVERILKAFKSGEKDSAEFWIELGGRFIYIRYFAMRDRKGYYRGCLEVSQDVTEIRRLQGQQRLLDWT